MGLLSNLFTVAPAVAARAWCRPGHRTNCFAVTGGNSCCVCIPSTATCFVIEMWGQGGGGAGSCCCMGACFGGQAGDYAWLRCTTTGTNHILCMCACTCNCCTPGAGLFTGSPGQLSRACNCTTGALYQVGGGCGGSTCCFGMMWFGANVCGTLESNPYHSNLAIKCCWFGFNNNTWCADGTTYEGPGSFKNYFTGTVNMPFQQVQGTTFNGRSCSCCTNFNFYVRGGCGWTSPSQWTCFNMVNGMNCGCNLPTRGYCGFGYGRGGTAYAGGAGQCCDCGNNAQSQYGGVNGNAPGGGGSSASGTGASGGCCLGSCGGLGVILISWS